MHDYHAHSNYSDGQFLTEMLEAAERADLEGIGIADHCNVSADERLQQLTHIFGFNLDVTYERRRNAIEFLRDRYDVRIYDAVEVDYRPADEAAIREFLAAADFEYAIGSVHTVDRRNLHDEAFFARKSESERDAVIETYVDRLVALIDSELFAIAAHLDLPQRNAALQDRLTDDHYHRIAAAFADSRTVPELNAGRFHDEYGQFHPGPDFRAVLAEYDVGFTLGTDAHSPDRLVANSEALDEFVDDAAIDTVTLPIS